MAPTAHYTLLPWYRTGLASAIDVSPAGSERGEIKVRLKTTVGSTVGLSADRSVRLIGPGDILGIDPRAVVRLDPRAFANDFEPNYLAAIEFFDEDFAWRYSPKAPEGTAGARLVPWLALVVFEDVECLPLRDQGEGFPRFVSVKTDRLPPPDELWAWAHTHLNATSADANNPRATADMLAREPMRGCCRIVAARKLRPNKSYHALLVPTFEAGRRAGIRGAAPGGTGPAWGGGAASAELPVYFEWAFRTGEEGDFESLARKLNPAKPDPHRWSKAHEHGGPPSRDDASAHSKRGDTLQALAGSRRRAADPRRRGQRMGNDEPREFQQFLAEFINLGEVWTVDTSHQISGAPALPNGIKLPIVLPPSYGRWHANVAVLEPAQAEGRWLEQVNLDPRNRVAAAFGTLVVQKNQEDFMARAWAQYGDLFRANNFRYRAQFMREVLTATSVKHIGPLSSPQLLAATQLTHVRVTASARQTVHGLVASSALPLAAVQPAMRRVLRTRGPLAARFGTGGRHLEKIIEGLASTRLTPAPTWVQPDERLTLSSDPPGPATPLGWLGTLWAFLQLLILRLLVYLLERTAHIPFLRGILEFLYELFVGATGQSVLSAGNLTPEAVAGVPGRLEWIPPLAETTGVVREEDRRPSIEDPRFSFAGWNFRQASLNVTEWLTLAVPEPPPRRALNLGGTAATLRLSLSPYATVRDRINGQIALPPSVKIAAYDPLEAIVAYPKFKDATYEHLKKISEEYVVPNLAKITNNSITLLEANWRFIESFLVGLNHEMARELLWREFRTDQRGTCFAQFWDIRGVPGGSADIHPIHGWKLGGKLKVLGENRPEGKEIRNNLVLVVRGDLLRRLSEHAGVCSQGCPERHQPRAADAFQHVNRRPAVEGATTVKHPVTVREVRAGHLLLRVRPRADGSPRPALPRAGEPGVVLRAGRALRRAPIRARRPQGRSACVRASNAGNPGRRPDVGASGDIGGRLRQPARGLAGTPSPGPTARRRRFPDGPDARRAASCVGRRRRRHGVPPAADPIPPLLPRQRHAAAMSPLDTVRATLSDLRSERTIARERLERLAEQRLGAAADHQADLDEAIKRLRAELDALRAREMGGPARELDPRALVSALDGRTSILLFPLRIQTRYTKSPEGAMLFVRVYPDDISVQSHDPVLTPGERSAGSRFWAAPETTTDPKVQTGPAIWRGLAKRFGLRRAAWIMRVTNPASTEPITPASAKLRVSAVWTLPERLIFRCYDPDDRVVAEFPGSRYQMAWRWASIRPAPMLASRARAARLSIHQNSRGRSSSRPRSRSAWASASLSISLARRMEASSGSSCSAFGCPPTRTSQRSCWNV